MRASALVLDVLGPDFLAYTLNMSADEVTRCFRSDDAVLDPLRESVVHELIAFLSALELTGASEDRPPFWHHNLDALVLVREEGGPTWPNAQRMALAGPCEVPTVRGDHRRLLAELARDVYPLFLIPVPASPIPDPSAPFLARALHQHTLRAQLEQAILLEPILRTLFPEKHAASGWVGSILRSTGSGGTVQLWGFPELLLKSGWRLARLEHALPSMREFIGGVLVAIDTVRKAAAGRPVSVPVRIGITGVLTRSPSLELPWGRLRHTTDSDTDLIPTTLDRQLTTTTAAGDQLAISYGGNLVLETQVPYRMRVEAFDPAGPVMAAWPTDLRSYQLIQERLETIQLALLLGVPGDPSPRVVPAWTAVFDPLSHGATTSWRDVHGMPSLTPCSLTSAQSRRWASWIKLIDERRTPSISVAVRRTLSAAMERHDPADALVDAVIAWENLVGADEGETTLRITTALAWLLSNNAAERETTEAKLKAIYRMRSRIVHGNPDATRLSSDLHFEALSVTLSALRVLFAKRPALLAEKSSKERSRRLMLRSY